MEALMDALTSRWRAGIGLAACAILALSCFGCARTPEPVSLGIGGRANATPSIAASGNFVSVAWGASTDAGVTDVYASVSRDGGRTFDTPLRVNDVEGAARLNGEQPPRLALIDRQGREPVIVVVWTASGAEGTRLLHSRSEDGGRSFVAAMGVPGADAAGNRGWEAIAAAPGGRVGAVWLDHRGTAGGSGEASAHHEHAAGNATDGVARAQLSKLYFAPLDASSAPQAITGGVCYCCKTTVAAGADGSFFAAWRHVYPGNVRDIAFTVSRDGGRTFAAPLRVSDDQWVLNGCPENGPAMAIDAQQRIHVTWPTLTGQADPAGEPTLALFYAMSRDGRTFTPRQQIPTVDVPRHVQMAIAPSGAVVVTWDEGAEGIRRVAFAHGIPDANHHVAFERQVVNGAAATYPVLAAIQDGVLAAWTRGGPTDSVISVERLPLPRR